MSVRYFASTTAAKMAQSVHDFTVLNIKKQEVPLSQYDGKVLLIFNAASKCGYTKQYAGLEKLYEELGPKGLEVIGFPCNQFGGQEPGTNEEIVAFCEKTYGVKFPMMNKIEVNGANAAPLYAFLKQATKSGDIQWNFEKFLVDKKGKVVKRFGSGATPESIKGDIQSLL